MHKVLLEQIQAYRDQGDIAACHQAVQDLYPELRLRWTQIYGRRWSHILGGRDDWGAESMKVRLNDRIGLILSHHEQIPAAELAQIIAALKEYLA